MPAERLFLLHFGWEPSPKWVSVRGGGDAVLRLPVVGALVGTSAGWVLLETGMGAAFVADTAARDAVYGPFGVPELLGADPLAHALAGVGVRPQELSLAAVSHLHVDHAGGLETLARAGVPVVVQAEELAFARERAGLAEAYHPPDYADPELDWRELDGDAELAPGVFALSTPGHTPGHMSYRVELAGTGSWLLAVDVADLTENIVERVPGGAFADPADEGRAEASLHRVIDEAAARGARLLPGHDPVCWAAATHPPGGWT